MRVSNLRPILSCTALLLAVAGCRGAVSLDPGPPPRPLLFAVDELRFGMTPAEVRALWGPGRDGDATYYETRPGWLTVSLGFNSYPPGMPEVQPDVAREPDGRGLFLVWVRRDTGPEAKAKATYRAELVGRFGPPLADDRLRRLRYCEAESCELFRAGECGLLQVEWRHPWDDPEGAEVLSSETWRLVPSSLLGYAPRDAWSRIRGEVRPELDAAFQKTVDAWPRGNGAPAVRDIVAALGPPNLVLDPAPGRRTFLYLALDDSVQVLHLAADHLDGAEGSFAQ